MPLKSACLFLLAALAGGTAASAAALPHFLPIEVNLVSSQRSISTLPIDVEALARGLCGGKTAARPSFGSGPRDVKAKCQISPTFEFDFAVVDASTGPVLQARQFRSAVAVETPCGVWDATLTLDPTLPQPVSPIRWNGRLDTETQAAGRGALTGKLEMDTQLHLANRVTGQTADFALRLGLGPWSLDAANASDADDPDDPNPTDECIPMSVIKSRGLDPKEVEAEGCTICPEDPSTSKLVRRK